MKVIHIIINTDQDFEVRYLGKKLPSSILHSDAEIFLKGNSASLYPKLYELAYVEQLTFDAESGKGRSLPELDILEAIQEFTNDYRYGREQYLTRQLGNYSIHIQEIDESNMVRLIL